MATISSTITHGVTLATTGNYASPLTITSAGTIDASSGYAIYGPGTQSWTVANQGLISAGVSAGIDFGFHTSGFVNNSGTIVGHGNGGIYLGGGGTVVNSGTINGGGGDAIEFFGSGANRLVLDPGYRLIGVANGSTRIDSATKIEATNTLELASTGSAGTVSAALQTEFAYFGAITVDAGARWTLTGNSTLRSIAVYLPNGVTLTDSGSLTNAGTLSISAGVTLTGGGYLGNRGTLYTAEVLGTGTVNNIATILSPSGGFSVAGTVLLANSSGGYIGSGGVLLQTGGRIVNGGRIVDASGDGVDINAAAGTVTNTGTIEGSARGVKLSAGGTVVDSGLISGGDGTAIAFYGSGANRLVLDPGYQFGGKVDGSTSAGATNTLELASTGSASTLSAATLQSEFVSFGTIAVDAGAQWTLTGNGTLTSAVALTGPGVLTNTATLSAAASVTLASGGYLNNKGMISATGDAVFGSGTVVNSGTILVPSAASDVRFTGSGSLTNTSTGYIGVGGLYFTGGGTIVNSGRIVDTAGAGIYLLTVPGGVVNTGTIAGSNHGFNGAGTVVDAGLISGGTDAVVFGSGANRLVLDPGYRLGGVASGSPTAGATNTLELAVGNGSHGTLAPALQNEFVHFGTITVDAGANWTLSGNSTLTSGVTLTDAGSLTNTGTLSIAGGATLTGGGYLDNAATISLGVGIAGSGTIVNGGSILGVDGLYTVDLGSGILRNNPGAYIGPSGVLFTSGGTAVNSGRIENRSGDGVRVTGGVGTVTNTGFIGGALQGVSLAAGGTVVDSGTIAGNGAITFYGSVANRLVLDPGYALFGVASGSTTAGATNTLELAVGNGSGGTLSAALQSEFANFGTITVDSGGRWTLTGNSTLGAAVTLTDSGTLTNAGTLSVASGVTLTGGYLDNTARMSATSFAVGGNGTIVNSGTIVGSTEGVYLKSGGTVTNSGTISGSGGTAIVFKGTAANRLALDPGYRLGGVVSGSTTAGATNTLELAVGNGSGGTLSAALQSEFANFGTITVDSGARWTLTGNSTLGAGVALADAGTLTNTGTLLAAAGVSLLSYLNNTSGATISGSSIAVGGNGTIVNAGTILAPSSGFYTLYLGAGFLTNTSTGYIGSIGLRTNSNDTIVNAGRIVDVAGHGIDSLNDPSFVSNSGTISGTSIGVSLGGGGTIVDSGTISGGTAVSFGGSGANRLVLDPGYRLSGVVNGSTNSGATNTLELDGAIGNALTVNYNALGLTNFHAVVFGSGGAATLDVSNTSGTLPLTVAGFTATTDIIDLTAIGANGTIGSFSTVGNTVTVAGSADTIVLQFAPGTALGELRTVSDGGSGTDVRLMPPANDFAGDGMSDILWQYQDTSNSSDPGNGATAIWLMNGTTETSGTVIGGPPASWHPIATGDFTGNGRADILWQYQDSSNSGDPLNGAAAIWLMNGTTETSGTIIGQPPASWHPVATGDFTGNGIDDILWQYQDTANPSDPQNGQAAIWLMNGTTETSAAVIGAPPASWQAVATGDFTRNGIDDILWQYEDSANPSDPDNGDAAIWLMNGFTETFGVVIAQPGPDWHVIGTGDFNGDGMSDILWQYENSANPADPSNGQAAIWLMNGTTETSGVSLGNPGSSWHAIATDDFNGDGKADIVWQYQNSATPSDPSNGEAAVWLMNGTTPTSQQIIGTPPASWHVI